MCIFFYLHKACPGTLISGKRVKIKLVTVAKFKDLDTVGLNVLMCLCLYRLFVYEYDDLFINLAIYLSIYLS